MSVELWTSTFDKMRKRWASSHLTRPPHTATASMFPRIAASGNQSERRALLLSCAISNQSEGNTLCRFFFTLALILLHPLHFPHSGCYFTVVAENTATGKIVACATLCGSFLALHNYVMQLCDAIYAMP